MYVYMIIYIYIYMITYVARLIWYPSGEVQYWLWKLELRVSSHDPSYINCAPRKGPELSAKSLGYVG